MPKPAPTSPTIGLDIGNLAEVNQVAISPSHVTHVRLTGTVRLQGRKLEIFLSSGLAVTMNFDESDRADEVFQSVVTALEQVSPAG